jgi:Bacterial dnaA protein helix-turn-helix
MSLREFASAGELMAHYRELHARVRAWAPRPPPPPAPEPQPEPTAEPAPPLPARMTPVVRILVAVAEEFNIPHQMIRSDARTKGVVVPRQVVVLLAKELTNASNRMIGIVLGHRDHTTIMHAASMIKTKMAGNPALTGKVRRLRAKLLELVHHERCDQDSERARDCGQGRSDAHASGSAAGCPGDGPRNL